MTYFGKDYCSYLTQSLVQRNASVVAVVCCSTASVPILSLFTGHKVCTPMANVLERFDMYMGNFKCFIRRSPFPGKQDSFFKSTNFRCTAYPLLFLYLLCNKHFNCRTVLLSFSWDSKEDPRGPDMISRTL